MKGDPDLVKIILTFGPISGFPSFLNSWQKQTN
jgi:hypothetical protein